MDLFETLVELALDSGETVLVRRLSPYTRQGLFVRAEELHPYPDKKAFEKPLADVVANAMPGLMMPAEDNPDYKAAFHEAKLQQAKWFNDAVIESGVVEDSKEGRELTIERYKPRIQHLRTLMKLPDDEWQATVLHGLITTREDRVRIIKASNETLTEEEIRVAMRSFRRSL